MITISRLLLVLSLVSTSLTVGTPDAQAQAAGAASDADAQAKRRFAEGQRLTAAGQYREALAEFTAGYALSRRPAFLFNMAECTRKLGDLGQARAYYERYLAEDPRGPLAATARQRLAELATAAPAPVVVPTTSPPVPAPPAPVVVPTARPPVTSPPAARPIVAAPPPATVAVAAASAERRTDLTAMPSREPASRPLWKRSGFWIGVGAAVVLTAGSVFLLSRGDDGPCGGASSCADLR